MSDVEFSDEIKEINFFDFAVICKVIEQFTNVRGTGYQSLNDSTKSLEDGRVIDRGEIELNLLNINVILSNLLLQFYLIFISCVVLSKVNISFIDENEHTAVVSIL